MKIINSLGYDTRIHEGKPQWSERGADTWNFFSGTLEVLLFQNKAGESPIFTYTPDYTGNCLIVFFSNACEGTMTYTASGLEIIESQKMNGGSDAQGAMVYIIAKCTKDTAISINITQSTYYQRKFCGIYKF